MSSFSVRFYSFILLYSVFNDHFLLRTASLCLCRSHSLSCPASIPRSTLAFDPRRLPTALVGSSGLEPPTSRLSGARSNHLSYEPVSLSAASVFFGFLFLCPFYGLGGDDGIRTHDPLLAGQVLSQLSYTPILGFFPSSLSLFAVDKLPQN